MPIASAEKTGFMSARNAARMGRTFGKGYRKLAESRVWYNHYSALIYAASPASTRGMLLSVSWAGTNTSAVRLNSNNNNVKLYMGDNPETGKHELWFGMIGVDGSASEFIIAIDSEIDWNSGTTDILPSYLSAVTIS